MKKYIMTVVYFNDVHLENVNRLWENNYPKYLFIIEVDNTLVVAINLFLCELLQNNYLSFIW